MTTAKKDTVAKTKAEPLVKGARVALTDEEAQEAGFFGFEVDPTPDEHYTVAGVTAGKPTPETDEKAAEAAKETKP